MITIAAIVVLAASLFVVFLLRGATPKSEDFDELLLSPDLLRFSSMLADRIADIVACDHKHEEVLSAAMFQGRLCLKIEQCYPSVVIAHCVKWLLNNSDEFDGVFIGNNIYIWRLSAELAGNA